MQTNQKLPQKKTRSLYQIVDLINQAGKKSLDKARPTDDPTTPVTLTTTHLN